MAENSDNSRAQTLYTADLVNATIADEKKKGAKDHIDVIANLKQENDHLIAENNLLKRQVFLIRENTGLRVSSIVGTVLSWFDENSGEYILRSYLDNVTSHEIKEAEKSLQKSKFPGLEKPRSSSPDRRDGRRDSKRSPTRDGFATHRKTFEVDGHGHGSTSAQHVHSVNWEHPGNSGRNETPMASSSKGGKNDGLSRQLFPDHRHHDPLYGTPMMTSTPMVRRPPSQDQYRSQTDHVISPRGNETSRGRLGLCNQDFSFNDPPPQRKQEQGGHSPRGHNDLHSPDARDNRSRTRDHRDPSPSSRPTSPVPAYSVANDVQYRGGHQGAPSKESGYHGSNQQHGSAPQCEDPTGALKNSKRIIGEIAFQLDRRILNYVFSGCMDALTDRRRFYGYTISNIPDKIIRDSVDPSSGLLDEKKQSTLERRYKYIQEALRPFGYNVRKHGELSTDLVNKYGLLPLPPHRSSGEGIGPELKDTVRDIVENVTPYHELSDVQIMLECLALLANEDGRPMIMF